MRVGKETANPPRVGVIRFEDMRVWQAAKEQCDRVGELLRRPEFRRDLELSDQMNRASISVVFNTTEGFLRRRDKETMQFLRYAMASNGELKAGYYVADGRAYLMPGEAAPLMALNESIARMLCRWYATLMNKGGRPGTKDPGRTNNR